MAKYHPDPVSFWCSTELYQINQLILYPEYYLPCYNIDYQYKWEKRPQDHDLIKIGGNIFNLFPSSFINY